MSQTALNLVTPQSINSSLLNNKLIHLVYETVSSMTTLGNASEMSFYSDFVSIPDLQGRGRSDIYSALRKLIGEGLVEQIFFIKINEGTPDLYNCFIAIPSSGTLEMAEAVYMEAIAKSARNISEFFAIEYEFDAEEFYNELDNEFEKREETLPVKHSVFSLVSSLRNTSLEIPLRKEIISEILGKVEKELLEEKILIKYGPDLYIPSSENQLLVRFETADRFIRERLLLLFNDQLGSGLDDLYVEEEAYKFNIYSKPTSSFQKISYLSDLRRQTDL